MVTRLLLQFAFVALPFVLFAVYRVTTADKQDFKEKWPFAALTFAGLFLTLVLYAFLYFSEPRGQRTCNTPSRLVDGKIVPGEVIPCDNASIDSRRGND